MNKFSHLSVLITIILGLGIAQLVMGLGRLIVLRGRIILYWPVVGWIGLLLVLHILTWWTMFFLREYTEWDFFVFLIVLLQPMLLYFLTALILSTFGSGESGVNIKKNYYANVRWFFGLFVLFLCVSLIKDLCLYGRLPGITNLTVHVIFIALGIAAVIIQREWYHVLLVPTSAVLIIIYIATLFPRLPT
ncbi:MAG: hypothetical protein H6Q52_133 [Deltaproteobacteria bacterium]|nr:hypothetical protein [Deltaproteobacteria bacterium]